MDARTIREQTQLPSPTDLQQKEVRLVARQIQDAVGDPRMHPTIPMKVARAAIERKISITELCELVDYIAAKRQAGELRSPGAYFVTSIRRVFQANEVTW